MSNGMRLKHIEISGFKSFAKKATLSFAAPVTAVVGPNGSGKSNVVESFRFVLGEQSMKSMRGKSGADLIFRGGTGAPKLSRASVSITFDNHDSVFAFQTGESKTPVLFDEITFTRELFADGTSRYLMNDTEIKLKQMVELLASVNIGTSSHHIISQGEADGILRANAKERREMLEDALGLKIYHLRIRESESKLGKTMDTLKEVQSLRRELAPHLSFLKKQVEKIEKGRALREELHELLLGFLAGEKQSLAHEEERIAQALRTIGAQKETFEAQLRALPEHTQAQDTTLVASIESARTTLATAREDRRTCEQKIGRLEGRIEAHRALMQKVHSAPVSTGPAIAFAPQEYHQMLSDIEYFITQIRDAQTLDTVRTLSEELGRVIGELKKRHPDTTPTAAAPVVADADIRDTVLELEVLQKELVKLITTEESATRELTTLERTRDEARQHAQSGIEERYKLVADIKACESELQVLEVTRAGFVERKERFDQELREAGFLFGPSFLHALHGAEPQQGRDTHELRRSIDRLKIRLEEHSGIGSDVVTEYESAQERDAFLTKELVDIEASIKNLEALIIELKQVLDERFTKGVETINQRFGEFFKTMFGGGNAFLSITLEKKRRRKQADESFESDEDLEAESEEAMERGIEVHVSLPEKKVKELTMLSGGERSLVSIALLFAISQVNPPPFLVLDETDAALDEANSRRYGDMVERLSEYSQLIVVTHNRETMSRASVLYGVTLGTDGGSKLLSIKFDEAVKVAK